MPALAAMACIAALDTSADGMDQLVAFCRTHQVSLVVMEATGGYERQPFGLLWATDLPTAVVNPRAVRDFAKAMGVLEKTDSIDCGIIAWFAETRRTQPTPPASATQARLTALVRRLRQLTDLRTQENNRRRLVTEPDVLADFVEPILAAIAGQPRPLETLIAQAIGDDPLWARLDAAFRTIKGVADRTVARLMAEMPEIGTLSNKAVGKLAGLTPIARDQARAAANARSAAAAKASAPSSSSSPRWCAATIWASPPSTRGWWTPASRKCSCRHRCRPQAPRPTQCQGA